MDFSNNSTPVRKQLLTVVMMELPAQLTVLNLLSLQLRLLLVLSVEDIHKAGQPVFSGRLRLLYRMRLLSTRSSNGLPVRIKLRPLHKVMHKVLQESLRGATHNNSSRPIGSLIRPRRTDKCQPPRKAGVNITGAQVRMSDQRPLSQLAYQT